MGLPRWSHRATGSGFWFHQCPPRICTLCEYRSSETLLLGHLNNYKTLQGALDRFVFPLAPISVLAASNAVKIEFGESIAIPFAHRKSRNMSHGAALGRFTSAPFNVWSKSCAKLFRWQ
jgi:hypothetical protein